MKKNKKLVKVICKETVYHNFREEDGILFSKDQTYVIYRYGSNMITFDVKFSTDTKYTRFFHCDDENYFETKEERRKRLISEICK